MATPDLEQLLLVQERDTTIDQIRHRRATLPEREELRQLEEQLAGLAEQLAATRVKRDDVERRQTDVEGDLSVLETRLAELDKLMYGGTITASRDLQAMVDEVDHLKRRRSSLEDTILAAMDEREPIDAEVARLEDEEATARSAAAAAQGVIAEAERTLDAEAEAEKRLRDELATKLPAPLTEQYERIRSRLGGVGAARLVGASCSGCHLTLPAVEVDRLKRGAGDALVLCDQCGRILVN
jgi:predicted  nucleic acid-binding Zn-ribbon protein